MTDYIPRAAIDGIVRHPLTGVFEFASTDHSLAEKVAATLDEHDPATVAWFFETLIGVHPSERHRAEWVMSTATANVIRKVADPRGGPLFMPAFRTQTPDHLLGQPIVIDEQAAGVTLRLREAVAR